MRDHDEIKEKAIENSYIAIEELQKVLKQPIDSEELDAEKVKQAVLGKKEAQACIFEMLALIESARLKPDEEEGGVGFAERFSKSRG